MPDYKTAGLLKSVHTDRMHCSCCRSARPQTLRVMCARMCVFYSAMCLAGWPLSSEAARLRCGSDLLSDLIFVCGDRGIYLVVWENHATQFYCAAPEMFGGLRNFTFHHSGGKGTWSGYGARPRGKGIVDQCCQPAGCELQHLEMYCAKPKSLQHTTAYPATTTASHTTTQVDTAQQFQAIFQKKLLEHLGPPNSPKREAYRKKTQPSPRRKSKVSSSRRKNNTKNTTSRPPSAFQSPLQRLIQFES